MKLLSRIAVALLLMCALQVQAQPVKYKCMLQMSTYVGEGAYVVVSLINPKGAYEKTLYVMGDDKEWYSSLKEWHKFAAKKPAVSARTGASVTAGDRSVTTFEIDASKMNKGYKLRFETAVEDQKYHVNDVRFR